MYLLRIPLVLTLLISLAATVPQVPKYRYVLHEKRESSYHGWIERADSPLPRELLLPMRIGMTQRNLEQAEELLLAISDPESPRYGKHYLEDEVYALFEPGAETVQTVKAWLHSTGVGPITVSHNKQWLQFDAPVQEVEALFQTQYHIYEHTETGRFGIACDKYYVPEHVTNHIDYIMPGLRLMPGNILRPKRQVSPDLSIPHPIISAGFPQYLLNLTVKEQLAKCGGFIFPSCIAALYNITTNPHQYTSVSNQLGIFEDSSYQNVTDLKTFFIHWAKNVPPETEPVIYNVDGAGYFPRNLFEANLDHQVAYPIVSPQNIITYQTDPYNAWSDFTPYKGLFNTFLDAIDGSYCNFSAYGITGDSKIDPQFPDGWPPRGYNGTLQCGKFPRPNVISLSYGVVEPTLPTNYQRRQCLEYLKLGMLGTTVFFSSGDSGVAADYPINRNGGSHCLGPNGTVFVPAFPSNCPWVTSVGATYLPLHADVFQDPERAVETFGSGGGFSNIYNRPAYQNASVENYLRNHNPPYPYYSIDNHTRIPSVGQSNGGRYNRVGRGYPDVSAVGQLIIGIYNGRISLGSGTSASTPVWAAIIARVNEERLLANKTPVGFINPVLYKNTDALHDITKGNNPGCKTDGFEAAKGWDPVTGLGTPDYPKLLEVFMSLP